MMRKTVLAMAVFGALGLAACEDEPDNAADALRDAGEQTGEALDEAADRVNNAIDALQGN